MGEEEKEEKDWEGGAPFKPSLFLAAFQQAHKQPFSPASQLTLSALSAILVERLQEKRGYHFLHSAFMRLQAERDRQPQPPLSSLTSASTAALLSSLQSLLVQHAQLLLQRAELLPERLSSGPRQLVSFLLSHCDLPSSSILGLLSAVLSILPPLRLAPLSQSIFAHLTHDMKEQTFIHADHWKPPAVLAHLLTLPPLAHHFTLLPHFIYPWFNGYKIETDSPLGLFLKLTTLPDEPSVGEKFFTQPLHMTDVERLFCMGRLNRKLDKAQDLLASSWCLLLRAEHSRAGLLTWTSTMLLSNWGRTRMRSQRKSTSNDGFLLNIASVMLRVGQREELFDGGAAGSASLAQLDPLYCLLPSRLDVKEETKICATTHDEQAWLNEFYAQAAAAGGVGGGGGSAGKATTAGGGAAVTAGAALREEKGRAVSMDEGEEGKEEKQQSSDGSMELSFSSSSSALDLATTSSSSSSSSSSAAPTATGEERKSKFKRARLSLGGLRTHQSGGGGGEVGPVLHSNALAAPPGSSSSSSVSPSSASAPSPTLPPSPALLPLPAKSPSPLPSSLPHSFPSTAAASSSTSFSTPASSPPSFPTTFPQSPPSSSSMSSSSSSSPPPSSSSSLSSSSSVLRVGDVSCSSAAEREYFVSSSCSTHYAIVCNKCRTQDLEGSRHKCLQCKDYDLCAACEQQTFVESLGLSHSTGVTFACPYHCGVVGLRERQLRDHVHALHESDVSLVACPICSANGSAQTVLTQPSFDSHLNKEHCDEHDPTTHVTLKVNYIIPHSHRKYFTAQEPFALEDITDLVSEAERREAALTPTQPQSPDGVAEANAALAELVTQAVVHRVACSHCHTFPIRGVAFKCHHCPSYWLCGECEGVGWEVHGHHPAHVFIKFRRPLQLGAATACDALLYPSAMLGSHGFSLHTEWFFLTLHTLHVGMLKTCSRYTSLVQSIESESDARKLDSLMKVKLCVDAQLLHPRLLKDSLALYVAVSRWMAWLIDPQHQGHSITLPLSSLSIPMEFAALPEYLIEVSTTVLSVQHALLAHHPACAAAQVDVCVSCVLLCAAAVCRTWPI